NQNSDRRAERFAFKNSGQDFATIFLFALRCDFALTGAAPVKLALNLRFRDVDLRRATIDHHTNAAAVRFTERGDPKKLAKGVHELCVSSSYRFGNFIETRPRIQS